MHKTIITTDSGCNPRDITNMIPCVVVDGNGNNYYDVKKVNDDDLRIISPDEAFDRAVSGEKLHTASPTISDYITVIEKYLNDGYNVVHLSMSNQVSAGSYNAANIAANMLNEEYNTKVYVIDTLTAGCGGTIINDYANLLIEKNYTTPEIVAKLEDIKKRILATFYISKVKGFVGSGRAPKVAMLSDRLSFRFRVDINSEGKLYPKLPPLRGSIRSQFVKYLSGVVNRENMKEYDPNYLTLLITKLNEIDIDDAKNYLESLKYFDKNLIKELRFYSAISAYGVEDQVGCALIRKKK